MSNLNQQEYNKYEEVLKQYKTELDDKKIKLTVEKLIEEKVAANNTDEIKRFLFGSIELTTLKTTDSDESVLQCVEMVNQFAEKYPHLHHVATMCVHSFCA